ncbi:MAG: WYL domain-containing protein [Pseudohongiella sp.]|nr:WYL domain-containing protein [Pseudohongiella sp.]MDP2127780.1 WYL domain-containing protein [Pseudohongiella sp.]
MDKLDRIQQLHQLFTARRHPIKMSELAEHLECTPKTVSRLIEVMRNYLFAPIEFVKGKGWAYIDTPHERFQLPGLWLTANELQSMALLLHVLENFGNGLLNEELKAVEQEIHKLLNTRKIKPETLMNRIKVLPLGNRSIPNEVFLRVGDALLKTRQITFRYKDFKNKPSTRTVSPQSLLYYRDNWYLDAWCHTKDDLRIFSLARIERVFTTDENVPATLIPQQEREQHFAGSYGIFAGRASQTATLRFHSGIAREISMQQWHPQQVGQWDNDEYVLSFPYGDERELVLDLMRYVPDVVVEQPTALRQSVVARLQAGLKALQKL